jgi:hypothetical protein
MTALVTLSGESFQAQYQEAGRAENRDGVLYYFLLTDLIKNRGPRQISLFLAGPERVFIDNLDQRLDTVRLNTIRRAFDSKLLDFVSPVGEGLGCKEIPLRARDFQTHPEAGDEQIRRFLKLSGYSLGFRNGPNKPNSYLDFDCPLDFEYLGTTSDRLARHIWLLTGQGYFESSAVSFPGTLRVVPTIKLVEEMEGLVSGSEATRMIQNIHFHGPNSRFNMNGLDSSVNVASSSGAEAPSIHERRVNALLAIHASIEQALFYLQRAASAGKFAGEASDRELLQRMGRSLGAASEDFSKNRLLISESLGERLDEFFNKIVLGQMNLNMALDPMVPNGAPRAKLWDEARDLAYKDLPLILNAIRREARQSIDGNGCASLIDSEAATTPDQKQQRLYSFVLNAIGQGVCIGEPMNVEKLSLRTVECRIRIHQEQDPEYAKQCGVPAVTHPNREKEITRILRAMQVKGLLKSHFGNRWSKT